MTKPTPTRSHDVPDLPPVAEPPASKWPLRERPLEDQVRFWRSHARRHEARCKELLKSYRVQKQLVAKLERQRDQLLDTLTTTQERG